MCYSQDMALGEVCVALMYTSVVLNSLTTYWRQGRANAGIDVAGHLWTGRFLCGNAGLGLNGLRWSGRWTVCSTMKPRHLSRHNRQGIGRRPHREATREQQRTAILSASAFRVDAQCTGWVPFRSREVTVQQYSAAQAQPSSYGARRDSFQTASGGLGRPCTETGDDSGIATRPGMAMQHRARSRQGQTLPQTD